MLENKQTKLFLIFFISFIVLSLLFLFIVYRKDTNDISKETSDKNSNSDNFTVFQIDKITLFSSANAISNSETQVDSWNLDIYQYTDIAIKINNNISYNELNTRNVVKNLYIDNISFPTTPKYGTPNLYYKNPTNYGIASLITDNIINDKLDYKITKNNTNEVSNTPTFYADCSNPLVISYINRDIVSHHKINNTNTAITFDGTLLKNSGILLSSINSSVSFTIHIINELDEEYVCDITLDIPLKDDSSTIYNGSYKIELDNLQNYKFIRK